MKQIYKNFLFARRILVNDSEDLPPDPKIALSSVMALAKMFSIRIKSGALYANESMLHDAEENLGWCVPEPFYRGFPKSVLELTGDELYFDQLNHYVQTYGMGWFDETGHSLVEKVYERTGFNEYIEPKDFLILDEEDATIHMIAVFQDILSGNRPLNKGIKEILVEAWKDFHTKILPEDRKIPCKDTVISLLYETKDISFCNYGMKLSDVIKLLSYIQYNVYNSENLKKLNLRNQDRKLLTKVLDFMWLSPSRIDTANCFEKRKIWCGLLHHIHYKADPKSAMMELYIRAFISSIRNGPNYSDMSHFEKLMKTNPVEAAKDLKAAKGTSAVVRHLNYILSRCNAAQVEEVLKCLE